MTARGETRFAGIWPWPLLWGKIPDESPYNLPPRPSTGQIPPAPASAMDSRCNRLNPVCARAKPQHGIQQKRDDSGNTPVKTQQTQLNILNGVEPNNAGRHCSK